MNRRTFGVEGERAARDYLVSRGYRILEMNYRAGAGEIDIIAGHRRTIVFIEVKRRASLTHGRPAEAVTPVKQRHILRTAMIYVQQNRLEGKPVRFDIIEITGDEIRHIESAFDSTGYFR